MMSDNFPATAGPLRFEPFLRPMVWGGRRLEWLGKRPPAGATYGESWEVSDHPLHRSVVAAGPFAGRTLHDLMQAYPEALPARAAPRPVFPWLIKFLDAADWLSVQVHPDDDQASELCPGEGGKTEVWFVLDAAPDSRIYAGLLPGVDEAALRKALAQGKAAECLHAFAPRPGDCVFLPAGTVHAVGGGVLFAEVQQTSDATFRLYDWDRRDAQGKTRSLHVEESMACIDWKRGPVDPIRANEDARSQPLVSCPFFNLVYEAHAGPSRCPEGDRLQALLVLGGEGILEAPWGAERLTAWQVWVFPGGMTPANLRPERTLRVLRVSLPDPV
jgi:mannose-6-phosphate isomerase